MSLVVLALAALAPLQEKESVVTIKRKASVWTFAKVPGGKRVEETEEGGKPKKVEYEAPPRLIALWEPQRNAPQNVFSASGTELAVDLWEPGKEYPHTQMTLAELAADTRQRLSELLHALLEAFVEFDLNVPAGSWEDVGRVLLDRLAAAYAEQRPEILRPYLPEKITFDLLTPPDYSVRYPAFLTSGVTLSQLRTFGLKPKIAPRQEAVPTLTRQPSGEFQLEMNPQPTLARWTLSDAWSEEGITLDVAFFNLGEKPGLPKAEDVVALFEMAWRAGSGPLFARVKYHPETKTLMIQARAEEIEAAQRAFASLTGKKAAPPISTLNPFDNLQTSLEKIAELLEKAAGEKKDE
jgi:hypothetical protein